MNSWRDRVVVCSLISIVAGACASEDTPAPRDVRAADAGDGPGADGGDLGVMPPPPPPLADAATVPDVVGPAPADGGMVDRPVVLPGEPGGPKPIPTVDANPPPPNPDGGPSIEVRPPVDGAAPNPVAVQIMPAGAQLVGGITVGCSYGPGTVGARWCAFAKSGDTLGKLELWVKNMSKLASKCDGTSPDCIRLTTNLFSGQPAAGPSFPNAHRFYGDLFVYHADPVSTASQTYAGPVYGWQPGWTAPKKISGTNAAFRCTGHSTQPLVLCIESLSAPEAPPLTFDLFAGRVDGTNTVVKIAKILPSHPTSSASQWGAGFSRDGKHFVYSTAIPGATTTAEQTPETLYHLDVDKIGATAVSQQVGQPGISSWEISPDMTKYFYMRDYNYSDSRPSGTLYMADFPSGDNPVRLASSLIASGSATGVAGYDVIAREDGTPGFIAFMQAYDGTTGSFRILKNPAASLEDATNVVKIVEGLPALPSNSADLRFGWYFLNRSPGQTQTTDSRILRYDGMPGCTLSAAPNSTLFGAPFLRSAGLAFWVDNYNPDSDTGDGMLASPADCTSKKRVFAQKIDYWFAKGDEQLLYTDEVNQSRSTLRVAPVVNGDLGPGTVIQTGIERFFNLLPQQEGVIYRLASGSAQDGIYYYKLP